MKNKTITLFLWWFFLVIIWGVYRYFDNSEFLSEVIMKPLLWGIWLLLGLKLGIIPRVVISKIREVHLHTKPLVRIFVVPALVSAVYFFLMQFRILHPISFSVQTFVFVLIVNFSTAIAEECIYRGVFYPWLRMHYDEWTALFFIQILFFLSHVPILLLYGGWEWATFSHALLIVINGVIYTFFFRYNKSLYSSIMAHGVWNTLNHLILL